LGLAHGQLGKFEAAEHDFRKALEQPNPSKEVRYAILVNRGLLRARQGPEESRDAIADLKAAIGLEPTWYEAYLNLASASENQKQLAAATEEMGRALNAARELYKTGRLAPSVMASLYANSARLQLDVENPNAALEDLSKATQVASRPEDYAERGRIL